jgi:hypothetical protein
MIKLIRNCLGKRKIMYTHAGMIDWRYFESLHKLQKIEGLRLANKLTSKHIYFENNKMKVKLAVQIFSDSVSKSKYNIAVNSINLNFLKEYCNKAMKYISNLKDNNNNQSILKCNRKTEFLAFIIAMRNIFCLHEKYNCQDLEYLLYLLTFKLSQDFLETFFCAVRGRRGFNNNPNALQFQSAYRRLLIRHGIRELNIGTTFKIRLYKSGLDAVSFFMIINVKNNIYYGKK